MMKVAMLSPGPSLRRAWKGENGYDLVVGVNRVPFTYRCDWWSLADDTAYCQHDEPGDVPWGRRERIGSPRLFVKRTTNSKVRKFGTPADVAAWERDEPSAKYHDECLLPPMPDSGLRVTRGTLRWAKYGGPTALCLCWWLGATEIDVFGVDMDGAEDAQGMMNATRHDQRWRLERQIWTLLVEGFTSAGVTVRRIL
jgi:hypothetical protein